jgi:Na+/melibiose symporter-like transporter
MRDRGYFLLFAPLTAAIFVWMSFTTITYSGMLIGMLLVMTSYRFVAAAYQGLLALVGQEQMMSGRLSALWQIVSSLPYILGALASGWVAEHLAPDKTFLLVAGLCLVVAAFALWRPAAVFAKLYDKPVAKGSNLLGDLKRLVRHRAIYPAVAINLLFNFGPGSNTPLQFYLTDKLHASDAVYSNYIAVFVVAFVPMFFVYGWLCNRVSLNKLLWWGTLITVPQMVPLAFIHSAVSAVWLALPIGLMGGIATGAYFDLAMRSCPPGLQGTLMMLVDGGIVLAQRGSDLLGSRIYSSSPTHGFLYCVIATTAVYASILLVLPAIPKALVATSDGERNAEIESAAAEAAATG